MKKYNLSKIMKRAWELVKKSAMTISSGLKKAWKEAKTMEQKLVELVGSPKQIAWAEDIRKNMISYICQRTLIERGTKCMYKYNQSEFESMMDELMHDFKKGCGKSDAELDVAYKILNPSPVGGFVDSLVKMDKDYSTNLWEIKRKQIKSFIPECDGYQLDDIVAYCRAKFFKEEVDRIIYDNSIAEECDVCVYADGTILSPEWPYLCAKVYVSIKWVDENKTTYTRIFPSAVGFMSYKTKGSMEDDLKQKENMSTTEMREHLKISRAEFSRRYNIPLRTLENWESGKSKCPDYVRQLLERAVLEDSNK